MGRRTIELGKGEKGQRAEGRGQVKTQKSDSDTRMGRDDGGLRRRSPRISALDACKENHQSPLDEEQRQLSRTRTCRIKRKFDDAPKFAGVTKLAKQVWKGRDSSQNANLSTDCMQWRSTPDLEMVKQNQKQDRDRAIKSGKTSIMPAKHILELVLDALQRRDTYEIFAEPVDPDEVEDYYEIIKEPMDFGTMRAKLHEGMYENLEQFEKMQCISIPQPPFISDSDVSSKEKLHSPSTSTFRRSSKKNPVLENYEGLGRQEAEFPWLELSFPSLTFSFRSIVFARKGPRDGRLMSSQVADRRFTYWTCVNNENDSVDSISYTTLDSLVLMNQGEINYKDSLMSFVKGLGPIAEKVARWKLLPQIEPKSRISAAKQRKSGTWDANTFRTFRDFAAGRSPALKACNIIDLTEDGEEAKGGNRRVDYGRAGKEKSDYSRAGKEKIDSHRRVNAIGKQDGIAMNRKSNEMGRRNKKSCIKWSVAVKKGQTDELSAVGQKERNKSMPLMSQFTFDLPFLKARLNEMNVGSGEVKRATSFEKGGGAERALNCTQQAESIVMKPFLSRQSSFNKLDTTNLALEL
ncbi:UNVERIFIED_CONTAM: hypothetical protein Scaly_1776300 [Sesamum calycinum]|uniref:Bromo domain-containing protein n=1 Tax=Sesamum calycinum TaxID=2727403 RepID=A0AAW2NXS9_9LAMI